MTAATDAKPTGFNQDILNLAELAQTIKRDYRLTEGGAIKIVDLGVSLHLTAMQMQMRGMYPGGAPTDFEDEDVPEQESGDGETVDEESAEAPQE